MDSSERRLRGRLGGLAKSAKYDAKELTAPARRGFMKRFIPGDPDLSEAERNRRAEAALKAHMTRLALKSAQARRRRKHSKAHAAEELERRL